MGQIKKILVYRRELAQHHRDVPKNSPWLFSQTCYDPKGNITDQATYADTGEIIERIIKECDTAGFVSNEKYYTGDEELSEEKSYERNENGLIITEYRQFADGSLDTTRYTYDNRYRIVEKLTTNDEGEVEQREQLSYRDDFLMEHTITDGDGNLLRSEKFEYDEAGNSIIHRIYDGHRDELRIKETDYNPSGRKATERIYDKDENLLERTTYEESEDGRLSSMIEETSRGKRISKYTYDTAGNTIIQEEFNDQEEQVVLVEREYNENGDPIRSTVFIDGEGRMLSQRYEVVFEYEFYPSDQ